MITSANGCVIPIMVACFFCWLSGDCSSVYEILLDSNTMEWEFEYWLGLMRVWNLMHEPCQGHLNAVKKICDNLFILKVPISNWLALKMQIWLLPLTPGQHCLLGVAIDNHYPLSSTEERYHALTLAIAGC